MAVFYQFTDIVEYIFMLEIESMFPAVPRLPAFFHKFQDFRRVTGVTVMLSIMYLADTLRVMKKSMQFGILLWSLGQDDVCRRGMM